MSQSLEITPQQLKRRLDAGERFSLIDVREPAEAAICQIQDSTLMPMNALAEHLEELRAQAANGPVVVYCHHGMRSLNAVFWLQEQGLENCVSLAGGIDRWSREIDPSIARY